jgi:hypothetical protein
MKKEILDIRSFITIVLVVVSLMGQKWSDTYQSRSDAQNLNFIRTEVTDTEKCITSITFKHLTEDIK